MSRSGTNVHPEQLRRLVLSRQGLSRTNAYGRGREAALRALTQLGYVQIDTISVVARAHHHVLRSRVDNYQPAMLDQLVQKRAVFEYWFHAAAYLPMADYRFALPRMNEIRSGVRKHWGGRRNKKMERTILDRIRAEGPLAARDFEGNGKGGDWWDWKPAKGALEVLFMQGDLMVTERNGFQKRYDLTERVLPDTIDTSTPSTAEYAEHLLTHALRNFAAVTVPEATYLRRSAPLRSALQTAIDERLAAGTLIKAEPAAGYRTFVDAQALEQRTPTRGKQLRILSPFDNLVIQRKRTTALFDFDYLIECYVPEPKRQYGYFCLPLLWGDTFVGRMDCKIHRREGLLEIKSLHLEESGPAPAAWSTAFAAALKNYLAFNGANRLKHPARMPAALRKALSDLG
ncbi:MAG: winged helix-turn-helix domain-containing protein [Pseudomonadales bacterium]